LHFFIIYENYRKTIFESPFEITIGAIKNTVEAWFEKE
jgi:hypothetical protein